jgi:hypothetical protein
MMVLAFLLFLAALLLPAIAQVRQAASRTQSLNNLKQLAIACHNHHDTFKLLPPIVGTLRNVADNDATFGTAHFHLLPYLEQDHLVRKAERKVWQNGAYGQPVPLFVDLGDRSAPPNHQFKGWLATTNYAANWMVFKRGDNTLINIQDGTSNTLMFAQRYQMCNGEPTAWGYPALYYWTPMFGYYSQAKFQHVPRQEECNPALPQSVNADGIQLALCDGSVRILSPRVSPTTWWWMTDPNDDNPLPADSQD